MEQERINKWPYAYDEHNNQVSISEAVKLSKRDWYGLPNKEIKFKPYFNNQTPHWKLTKDASFTMHGKIIDFSNFIDESFEHKDFKGKIIAQNYFTYKNHKILIANAEPEKVLQGSRYRADVKANLLDGTECIIEVIKSSDLSEQKQNFITENQILTFKIYIDDKGNQIHGRDSITGNTTIEQIATRVHDGEGKIAELRGKFIRITKELHPSKEDIGYKLQSHKRTIEIEIEIEKRRLLSELQEYESQLREPIRDFEQYQKGTSNAVKLIEEYRERIQSVSDQLKANEREIERLETEINLCKSLERQISKIAKDLPTEWFGYIPVGVNKLNQILYMIS
jgi:hypothetical protein